MREEMTGMSRLVNFQTKHMPAIRVIGKGIRMNMDMKENPIPALWEECFAKGAFKALEGMHGQIVEKDYVGLICDWSKETKAYTYICGMIMNSGCPVPEGFTYRDFPASAVAIGWVQGPEKDNYKDAHVLTLYELERRGFKTNDGAGWWMELYNCPRFTQPQPNGEVILDYYIPCLEG